MAAVRLIALHANKGRSIARTLSARTDYAKNPEKTEKGELVTAYGCDPMTVDEEFMLQKRLYYQKTGRSRKDDVIAYQIRQSFKPGEITPEDANRLGHELALRFTKGQYSFIVATHTDRAHIHNHIVFNSTAMDGTKKFRNFYRSGLALQKISDLICLEHSLSVITPAPYAERKRRTEYPKQETVRDKIRCDIDRILEGRPQTFLDFVRAMQAAGYEVRQGKYLSVKGNGQQRFVRLSSLGEGYREEDIRRILAGGKRQKQEVSVKEDREKPISLFIDVQRKMQEKGPGYARWATVYNLKQMAKTLMYLRDHQIDSLDQLQKLASQKAAERDAMLVQVRASEKRLVEIAALRKHIINYAKTRNTYEAYRKAGYSKKFYEAHREELTIHKAAKQAFDELGVKKLPKVKELNAEYAEVFSEKKAAYAEYRKRNEEAKELAVASRNIASLYEAENQGQSKGKDEKSH